MIKILYWVIGVVSFVLIASIAGMIYFNNIWFKERPNYLTIEGGSNPIPFKWSKGVYGDYVEPHNIIKIQVQLEGLKNKFYMQFDTGSPSTVVLGRPLESLKKNGHSFKTMVKDKAMFVEGFNFQIGENKLTMELTEVVQNYGRPIDFSDTLTSFKIGTIGADMLGEKITVIDFEKNNIQLYDERPAWMSGPPEFTPFSFKGRRLMLPVEINNKEYPLFYDSGSSAFGLITTKKRFKKYADKDQEEIRYDANSWGNSLPICHNSTNVKMQIGQSDLPLKRVSYMDKYTFLQNLMAPFSTIGGWLGNKPFIGHVLILDTKKEEFLVVKNGGSITIEEKP